MNATIHHQLNASLLGRCVLAMASGYDEAVEPIWPDSAILAMAGVFEQLAAEITVLTQNTPQLTAEDFARLLLEEVDPGAEDDDDDLDDDHWHQHPSLSAEERN